MNKDTVVAEAMREIEEEKFKAAVAFEKERLLRRQSFWVRTFPWRLCIVRRDDPRSDRPMTVFEIWGICMLALFTDFKLKLILEYGNEHGAHKRNDRS